MIEESFMALATKAELSKALTFYTVMAIIVSVIAAVLGAFCGVKILRLRTAIGAIDSDEKKSLVDEVRSTKSDLSATSAKALALESALAEANTKAEETRLMAVNASKPRPLKDRIAACLEAIDPKIITGIRSGGSEFEGFLKPWQFSDIQKISTEPGAAAYFRLKTGDVSHFSTDGILTPVHITILQSPLP